MGCLILRVDAQKTHVLFGGSAEMSYFCTMKNGLGGWKWSENVILADADYVDKVAFNLIVNFERMIGRRIPKADMARWLDCIALDGGLREGENEVQVVLAHKSGRKAMENFAPGDYASELDGKAFKDNLGEFQISAVTAEGMAADEDFFIDALGIVASQGEVKRLMVVPDADHIYNKVKDALRYSDDEKRITVFAMQPMAGGNFRQEILGYSLMSALGIRADEIKQQ